MNKEGELKDACMTEFNRQCRSPYNADTHLEGI